MREPLPRLPAEGTANVLFQSFRTQAAIRELMQGVLAGTGVSGEEYAILGVVHFFPDRTPTELAAALGIPPTSVSRQVASLLERGLAQRHPNPEDGRSYLLRATAKGSRAVAKIAPRIADRVEAIGAVSDQPLEQIAASLASLETAIKEVLATER
jgi:DNA-binding MarR family transcriptional regulator